LCEEPGKLNGQYVVWQKVPYWPQIKHPLESIAKQDKVSQLASVLPGGEALVWIKDSLTRILAALQKLADAAP
jgi:hypothetical protein